MIEDRATQPVPASIEISDQPKLEKGPVQLEAEFKAEVVDHLIQEVTALIARYQESLKGSAVRSLRENMARALVNPEQKAFKNLRITLGRLYPQFLPLVENRRALALRLGESPVGGLQDKANAKLKNNSPERAALRVVLAIVAASSSEQDNRKDLIPLLKPEDLQLDHEYKIQLFKELVLALTKIISDYKVSEEDEQSGDIANDKICNLFAKMLPLAESPCSLAENLLSTSLSDEDIEESDPADLAQAVLLRVLN